MSIPTIGRENPGPGLPRRLMTHMLGVSAFEVCDPMLFCVLMESDNTSFQALSLPFNVKSMQHPVEDGGDKEAGDLRPGVLCMLDF